MAVSLNTILIGKVQKSSRDALIAVEKSRVTGYGLEETVKMGLVINSKNKELINGLMIGKTIQKRSRVLVDGRNVKISRVEQENFIKLTIIENLFMSGKIIRTEIFGPVMSLIQLKIIEEVITLINS
ncbi:MAG: aldehyde dehydrogenase family protein [Flavobacteriales bacterium AspAUS03]